VTEPCRTEVVVTAHQVVVSTVGDAAPVELHSAYRDDTGSVACHLLLSAEAPRMWKERRPHGAFGEPQEPDRCLRDHQEKLERCVAQRSETEDPCDE